MSAPVANDVSAGLQSFAQSLTGLSGLNQLGQSLPFTAVKPGDATGLDFAHTFTDSLQAKLVAGGSFTSLTQLQGYLQTNIAGTYDGVDVTVPTATISPQSHDAPLYTIELKVDLKKTAATPLALDTPAVKVDGGSLDTSFETQADLFFKYDPAQADGNKFYLDAASNPTLTTTASASASPLTAFDVNLGFTNAHVSGSADVGATITAQLQDPDGNGHVTQTEWSTTDPQQQFDVGFTASHANANLSLTSDITNTLGGALTGATITESDSNLADGLATPTVSLGDLGGFKNIQPQDFLSGLASLAVMIQSFEQAGPAAINLPFLHRDPAAPATDTPIETLNDVVKLNQGLIKFFVDNGLSGAADPLTLNLDPAHIATVSNVQDVLSKVESALGPSAPLLGLAYDPTSKRLTFSLGQSKTLDPINAHVSMGDQLKAIGLNNVDSTGLQAEVDPNYAWHVKFGVDLNPAGSSTLNDRLFLVPSGTDLSANFPISGALSLAGQVGFLGLQLKSAPTGGSAGSVQLLGPADVSKPMIDLKLKPNVADRLTLAQIFDAFGSADHTADPFSVLDATSAADIVNATVPPFDLQASAGLNNGTNVVSGTVHVAWPNVTTGTPTLSADSDFNTQLLDFDYDPSNPQAMFTQLLNILGPVTQQVSQLVQSNPSLQDKLPVINKSFADLVSEFTTLSNTINDFASNPQGFLQSFELALEDKIAQSFGLPTDRASEDKLVTITLTPGSGSSGPTVHVQLAFGICTEPTDTHDAACSISTPLHVPLSLSLPDIGGLVSVTGTGGVDITAKAIVKIGLGITLPQVSPGLGGGDPSTLGAPALFIDTANTALNLDLHAATSEDTTLSASVGPLTMTLGKTDYAAESGTDCDNATDDNGNGVVNDGCPQVGDTAENATTGECSNATDDDTADADTKINDGCPTVQLPIEAKVGAQFHLSHDSGNVDPTDSSALTSWLGDLVPSSTDDLRPADKATCTPFPSDAGTPSAPYDACASIPVFVKPTDTSPAGNITFVAQNIFDPSTWHGQVDDSITTAILGQPLDWLTVVHGLSTVVHNLRQSLDASAYGGASIPVIGHSLDGGAKIADKLDDDFVQPLNDLATQLDGVGDFSTYETTIRDLIWNHLGSGSGGAGLILPYDSTVDPGATPATESDINVTLECGSDLHVCGASDSVSGIMNAEVSLAIGGTIADSKFKFDSGFPGLRLTMDKDIDASIKFRYDMSFGLSRSRGFYLRTDEPSGTKRDKELTVDASVHLPDTGTHGDIAFLRVDVSNNNAASHDDLGLQLAADIKGGEVDTDGARKLAFSDLTASDPSDPADVAVTLEGGIHLNLKLVLSANLPDGSSPGVEGALPKLDADFLVDWDFGAGFSLNDGVSGHVSSLDIKFDNVQLDLGSFFDEFLGPIVRNIQSFTKPLQPIIDTAEAPIPGISQLSELAGQGPVTFLDFFEHATGADLTMLHRLIDIIDLINNLPSSGSLIDLGHFSLDSNAAEGPAPTGDNADKLIDTSDESNPADALTSGTVTNSSALTKAESDGGLTFPAFQHPQQLFQLLVGKDVKLIEFDAGDLSASFGFDITIGPFPAGPVPVSIIIGGSAGIQGHFAIGYSTRGIREAVKALTDDDPSNDGFFQNASLLIDGIFIDDLDQNGTDVPEIRLTAEVHAGAEVDIVIASAGIEVGIQAAVDLNLHDGGRPTDPAKVDGLLYMDEIGSELNNPICIFDVSGELDAFVKFFIDVGFSPFDVSFEITLVDVTLLNMKDITGPICDNPPPPHLAQEDDGSQTLILKIGPNTPGRNIADGTTGDLQTNEKIVVRQLDDNAGDAHSFSVTAFGLTQNYPEKGHPAIKRIFADGGNGKDSILMQPGVSAQNTGGGGISTDTFAVTVPVEICGGSDNDTIQGGDANDLIVGDGPDASPGAIHCPSPTAEDGSDGVDHLGGGLGDDVIDGNGGGDTIIGEDGTDTVNAGSGDDNVQGGAGPDTINGDAGIDTLSGGPEVDPASAANVHNCNDNDATTPCITNVDVTDTINGGDGADNISGDPGPDHLNGDAGNDSIAGGTGDDTITGGGDDDLITAGDGNDTVNGNDGQDKIFGQPGNDTLNGDAGDDSIVGSTGNDTVNGGDGADWILGDDGVLDRSKAPNAGGVSLTGTDATAGNDTLNGDAGNDLVYGQGGADTLNGGADNDELHGNTGADTMNGDANDDTMFGDAGTDTMNGGDGNDTMRGGTENDTMNGNANDDTMFGDQGTDTMHGNDGVDHMRGGTEADVMYGDTGDDVMNGDAGADTMYGNDGNDAMHGDADDDYMEGNGGTDAMTGDAGQDDMIGGTSVAASADAGDTMCGGDCVTPGLTADNDVMVGDNGTITRTGTDTLGAHNRTVALFDLSSTDTTKYGNDTMSGDQGRDLMYGGNGNDTMHGNSDDDYVEGNSGSDSLYGDEGQDDLIGGTSQDGGGTPDGNDCIQGDARTNTCNTSGSGGGSAAGGTGGGAAGGDVMIGDNGSIARSVAGADWVRDSFGGGSDGIVRRTVTQFDVATTSSTPVAGSSGDDYLFGDDGRDIQYGQGGNDVVHGGGGDDYAEGNAGSDQLFGEAGDDDLIGGGKDANLIDAGDTISGGGDNDVATGDNALITRPLDGALHWIHDNRSHTASSVVRRAITLRDVATTGFTPNAGTSGADTITGDDGADQLFGQGADDTIGGGGGDDYAEGNAGNDALNGGDGRDDLTGGGSANDGVISAASVGDGLIDGVDTIHGDGSGDAIAGDNARITRLPAAPAAAPATLWQTDPNTDADAAGDSDPVRLVQMFDLDKVGSATPSPSTNAGDNLFGDDGRDIMAGQGGDDTMSGGNGVDYMVGNAGNDTVTGDDGEDDLIGGSSSGNGLIADTLPAVQRGTYSTPRNLRDGNDTISGNGEDDAIAGDNASIARPEIAAGSGLWWRLTNGSFDLARRIVTMEKTPESAGAFGDDTLSGGDGNDDLYGQLGNDTMRGDVGEDAMVGDLGQITNNLIGASDSLADPSGQQVIAPSAPFFDPGETIFPTGSLYRQVELYAFDSLLPNVGSGDDTMFGGDGHDSMHGGPGADVMDGNGGDDYLFADDSTLVTFPLNTLSPVGSDALWGGPGHDTMFGGHGVDFMDVLPRPATADKKLSWPKDPQSWLDAVLTDPVQADGHAGAYDGGDIMYGGWDRDWMQMDVSGSGPPPGDRAIDWQGGFNAYYRCDSTYGDWGITRQFSPSMQTFLQTLAFGMGATQTTTLGTSGYDEVAMVFAGDGGNANPVNPDNPGHFTCGIPHS